MYGGHNNSPLGKNQNIILIVAAILIGIVLVFYLTSHKPGATAPTTGATAPTTGTTPNASTCPTGYVSATASDIPAGTTLQPNDTQLIGTITYCNDGSTPIVGTALNGADCTREPLYLLQAKMYNSPTNTVSMPSTSLTEGSAVGWAPYSTTPIAYVCSNQAVGTVPLYRGDEAGNTTGRHLTSMDPKEITNANFALDFNGTPLAYVYPSQIGSTVPVIRELNPTDIDHILTTDTTQWPSWTPDPSSTIFYAFPTAS